MLLDMASPRLHSYNRPTIPSVFAIHQYRQKTRSCFVTRAKQSAPGEDEESKAVLNAFFLGKAFADALSERVGSALGEFLSDVGRKQAEQQKQLREFQDEVQERAKTSLLKTIRAKPPSPSSPSSSPDKM